MNKTMLYITFVLCVFSVNCQKNESLLTHNEQPTDETLPEDKNEFNVNILSPDSGSLFYKENNINFQIEAHDSLQNPVFIDSLKWSSNKSGIFFRWYNDLGVVVFPGLSTSLPVGEHIVKVTIYSKGKIGFKKILFSVLDTVYIKTISDNENWSVYQVPTEYIYEMGSDSQGNVLIGTLGSGLVVWKNNQSISYTTENSSLLSNSIQSIAIDHNNNTYVGHWDVGGINKFNGSTWSVISPHDSSQYARVDVHSIAFGKNNKLWAAIHDGTIYTYDGNWEKISPDTILFGHPGKILFDTKGNLWGNAEHNYAFKYDGMNWQIFNTMPRSYEMAIDNNDNVWFGSWSSGLYRYDGSTFINYNTGNSILPTNDINALTIDKSDNLWIGTSDGLVKYNGVDWTVFKTDNSGLPDNDITCLTVDDQNNIWIGTPHRIAVYKTSSTISKKIFSKN